MTEFGFELRLAAHLEREGLPGSSALPNEGLLGRQLGTSVAERGGRIMDLVWVEPGPEFQHRLAIGSAPIPDAAIRSDVGVGRFRPLTRAIDAPPAIARQIAAEAVEAGFFEAARRSGRTVVRRATRYPEWFGRLIGIENKPDLSEPGGLASQLRRDVTAGVLDAVILATRSYVTRAHLNRLPAPVGVWRLHDDPDLDVEVIKEPRPLDSGTPGLEVVAEHPGRFEVEPVSPEAAERQRRRVAERAFGKGWRTWTLPPCENARSWQVAGTSGLPGCAWADRIVNPASECGPHCSGFERVGAGDTSTIDLEAERDRRTAWDPDPPGVAREQAALDDFPRS
ncbi:MAG: DUF5787 family protein [Halodesulfurarchaeum sp.]